MATQGKLAVVLFALCVAVATSYPHGAPESACPTLVPDSHGPSTAKGPNPYKLSLSSTTYSPNEVILVTLSGAAFKGYLIVGRVEGSTDPVGSFHIHSTQSRPACTATPGSNGITHTNNTVKYSSVFHWHAPSSSVGVIYFNSTVVRGGAPNTKPDDSDYYLGVLSASLTPSGFVKPQIPSLKQLIKEKKQRKLHAQGQHFEQILANAKPLV